MSEFSSCKVCGTAPEHQANGMLYHPCLVEHSEQQCPLEATESEPDQWRTLMGQGEAVEYQFYDPGTGRWHGFMNDKHRRATAEDGYEIRALYTTPQPAVDDAVLRDAARYRYFRRIVGSIPTPYGESFIFPNVHMLPAPTIAILEPAQGLDHAIDNLMKGA